MFELRKFKVAGGVVTIIYTKVEDNGDKTEYTFKRKMDLHPDSRRALADFSPWLADVFRLDPKVSNLVACNGVTVSGHLEKEAVILTGLYTTKGQRTVSVNSELLPARADEGLEYKWLNKIGEALDELTEQAKKIVFEGFNAQTSIFELER